MSFDLSSQIRKARDNARLTAKKAYEEGNYTNAANYYEKAAELTLRLAEYQASRKVEMEMKKEALGYREIAQRLTSENGGAAAVRGGGKSLEPDEAGDKKGGVGAGGEFEGVVNGLVHTSTLTWQDIGGLADTKADVKYTLGVSLAKPPQGVHVGLWRNILFYGPPGTGKTLLAAATSNALRTERGRALFFNVKVSNVMSKYFGESSKIISELYGTARDHSPAVVFLDEFESLSPKRNDESTGAERRILSTILAELDGLSEKGRSDIFVLTIAATNRPWDIDSAVLSRFEKKILIPLPDRETRKQILNIQIDKRGYRIDGARDSLLDATEGFSGREIERLCKEAIGRMIQEQNRDIPKLVDQGLDKLRGYQLRVRPLTLADFEHALAGTSPATSPEEMKRYEDWREQTDG